MKAIEAYNIIKEEVEGSFSLFDGLGLYLSTENEACERKLKPALSIDRASTISSTLTIGADGMSEDDYYCIYLGINVRRGEVNDEELSKALAAFRATAEKTAEAIKEQESPAVALAELGRIADEEFKKIVEKTKKRSSVTGIGMALFWIGILIIFLVASQMR